MAFVGFDVPADAAMLLEGLDVPGDRESASDMHVTIINLGKDVPILGVAKAMVVAHSAARATRPMAFSLSRVSSFPAGNDGVPVICPIDSPELQALHSLLKSELSRLGVPFSDKFPKYRPHVTLGYLKGAPDGFSVDVELPSPVLFSVSQLCLWGGNASGPEVVRVSLPLSLTPEERVATRVARMRVRSASKRG